MGELLHLAWWILKSFKKLALSDALMRRFVTCKLERMKYNATSQRDQTCISRKGSFCFSHWVSFWSLPKRKENKRKIKWLQHLLGEGFGSCLRAFAALICKAESKVIIEDAEWVFKDGPRKYSSTNLCTIMSKLSWRPAQWHQQLGNAKLETEGWERRSGKFVIPG